MKILSDILKFVEVAKVIGNVEMPVTAIEFDSRKVQSGCLFVAIKGTLTNGHDYIEKAIELCEYAYMETKNPELSYLASLAFSCFSFLLILVHRT